MRAVRPFPLANGWIRTHSACAHAHRSMTAARPSVSSASGRGYRASSAATALCKVCSKAASSEATRSGGAPPCPPTQTRVVSRPGSPRKRPTYFLSGTLRPAIVSPRHRRASSTVGTALRAARSRTSRRTPTRFCRSLGLSASQSATYQLAHQPLGRSLCASSLTLHWVLSGRFGFGVGELGDRRFEVRVRLSVGLDAAKRLLELPFDGRGTGIEVLAYGFVDQSVQRHSPQFAEERQPFLQARIETEGRRLASTRALRSGGRGAPT